jgi:flagellar hook-length control protein FliK
MEALSILPVKASHQTAKSQRPSGLGDVFAALLQGATIRLDARPTDLASFETRRTGGEMPRNASAAETISSVDRKDWRDDAGFRADDVEDDGDAAWDRVEAPAPARDYAEIDDDGESAAPAPEDGAEPNATADDDTAVPADPDTRLAEGEDAEAPAAQDDTDPAPEAIAAPVALPAQAQPVAAVTAVAALARAATLSEAPAQAAQQAQAAGNTLPAGAARFGVESGAARVQITPAAVVAHPNAALGGGATVAALAAEAGQLAAQNGAQNGAQNAQAGLANAASQIAATTIAATGQNLATPGNPNGRRGPAAGTAAGTTQSTSLGQNGNALAPAAQAAVTAIEAAPGSGLPSHGPGGAVPGATGAPASPTPQNAQTPFAESNNQNGAGATTPSGLSASAPASVAGAQNRLAQNARTDTAQSLGAPVPGADGTAGTEGGQQAGASRTVTDATQGARPTAQVNNHNNTAQAARGEGSAAAGTVTQATARNPALGTATSGERAMAPASAQRAEGAGQASANNPLTAGTLGLTQAAARTPQSLPAQARPAASLPAHQVAVHIQRAVSAGQDRIRITLHPAELGQIDVKLSVSNDGAVKAIVSIERPETFELLARDARGLEKALQDAGLKTDSGSLNFNLKGESEQDAAARREGAETGAQGAGSDTPAEPELAPETIAAASPGGIEHALDLHV